MDSSSSFCFNRLPKHLFEMNILAKLSLKDLIRFGAISHSMRYLASEIQDYYHQLPWLFINQDKDAQVGTFFSLSDSRIHHLKLEHVPSQSYCCGSTQGYLIMANRHENFLYNPFSHNHISLPQQYVPWQDTMFAASSARKDFRHYFIKAILSSLPMTGTSKCVVAALCSNTHVIEMCRPHDADWSIFSADKEVDKIRHCNLDDDDDEENYIEVIAEETGKEIVVMDELETDDKCLFADVFFFKGMLYGLTHKNHLVSFELEKLKPTYRILNILPMEKPMDSTVQYINNYLVESCGALLMVYRFRKCSYGWVHTTIKFVVYKLDISGDVPHWVELKSIGDQMIFLGRNSSISISAKGLPGFNGNCIYFTEDSHTYFYGEPYKQPYCSDNGICYLDDGRIESIICLNDTRSFNIQPLWVTPYSIK